jgi:hypothetical protein
MLAKRHHVASSTAPDLAHIRLEMPRFFELVRRDWWWSVLTACLIWAVESMLEGNTLIEVLIGPIMVAAWAGVILLLDRWITSDHSVPWRGTHVTRWHLAAAGTAHRFRPRIALEGGAAPSKSTSASRSRMRAGGFFSLRRRQHPPSANFGSPSDGRSSNAIVPAEVGAPSARDRSGAR